MKKEILKILEARIGYSEAIYAAWSARRRQLGMDVKNDNFADTDVYRFYEDIKKEIERLDSKGNSLV